MINQAIIKGKIVTCVEDDEKNYRLRVATTRRSGVTDIVKVLCEKSLYNVDVERGVLITGELWSRNIPADGKMSLDIYIRAKHVCNDDTDGDINDIVVEGRIDRDIEARETPFGKRIADVMLSMTNKNEHAYIPSILWGGITEWAEKNITRGDKVAVAGRLQSRTYEKKYDERTEKKVAWEFSIGKIIKAEIKG